jgi:hypothetical protein
MCIFNNLIGCNKRFSIRPEGLENGRIVTDSKLDTRLPRPLSLGANPLNDAVLDHFLYDYEGAYGMAPGVEAVWVLTLTGLAKLGSLANSSP